MEPTQETNELIASIRTRENDNRYLLDGVSSHLLAEVEALKCEFQIQYADEPASMFKYSGVIFAGDSHYFFE